MKGALVLLMVFYHWLNYFIGLDWPGYPFLRFLTPSFLFITGFIVGRVYLVKYAGSPWYLARRSWHRGLKLLSLFAFLNLADTVVSLRTAEAASIARAWPLSRLEAVFLHGAGGAAFSILLPIAYFLLAVPLVWWILKVVKVPLPLLAAAVLTFAILGSQTTLANTHVEFLSIGLAGAGLGTARRLDMDYFRRHLELLGLAYVTHLAAIAVWNAPFAVQVVTTYLNVLLLYALACRLDPNRVPAQVIIELGKYSLFAYIMQIAVLQALRLGLPIKAGAALPILAITAALIGTWGAVRAMALLRHRSRTADRCYRAVFA